jgi:hypothetical protein
VQFGFYPEQLLRRLQLSGRRFSQLHDKKRTKNLKIEAIFTYRREVHNVQGRSIAQSTARHGCKAGRTGVGGRRCEGEETQMKTLSSQNSCFLPSSQYIMDMKTHAKFRLPGQRLGESCERTEESTGNQQVTTPLGGPAGNWRRREKVSECLTCGLYHHSGLMDVRCTLQMQAEQCRVVARCLGVTRSDAADN